MKRNCAFLSMKPKCSMTKIKYFVLFLIFAVGIALLTKYFPKITSKAKPGMATEPEKQLESKRSRNQFLEDRNSGTFLYSAFLDLNLTTSSKKERQTTYEHANVIAIAWQTLAEFEMEMKCCLYMEGNYVVSLKATNSHGCCYGKGQIKARRVECRLEKDYSNVRGVTLTKSNSTCPIDEHLYLKPTVLNLIHSGKLAVCNKYLHDSGPDARMLLEWFEVNKFLGVDKFTIHYEPEVKSDVRKVLKFYENSGLAEVLEIDAPLKDSVNRHPTKGYHWDIFNDEQVALWDCRERNKYYEINSDFDSDEFLVPSNIQTNASKTMIRELFKRDRLGVLTFYSHIHLTSWNVTQGNNPLLISRYPRASEPIKNALKNIYMPMRVKSGVGTIHSVYPKEKFKREFIDPSMMTIHHIRACRAKWSKSKPSQEKVYRNGTAQMIPVTCKLLRKTRHKVFQELIEIETIKRRIQEANRFLNV